MHEIVLMFKEILKNKKLLLQFSLNDFKARYAGSALGVIWAFVNPLVMVFTYGLIFTVIRSTDNSYPFIVYLVTGLIPWFFFSDTLLSATSVFKEYSYLVKKVVFSVRILPTSKLLSSIYTHFFFILIGFILATAYGFTPGLHNLQIIYYLICLIVFLTGVTWITSAVQPFLPDILQLINILMQTLMWSLPILWDPATQAPRFEPLLKINPLYYIVQGYRESFLGGTWFWQHGWYTLYFWVVTFVILFIGATIFKRLKPHFSDVL